MARIGNPYDDVVDGLRKYDPSGKEIIVSEFDQKTGFEENFSHAWGLAFANMPLGLWFEEAAMREHKQKLLDARSEGVLTNDDFDAGTVGHPDGTTWFDWDRIGAIYTSKTGEKLETTQQIRDRIREGIRMRQESAERVFAESDAGGSWGRGLGGFAGAVSGDPFIWSSILVGGLTSSGVVARNLSYLSRLRHYMAYNAGLEGASETYSQVFSQHWKEQLGIEIDPGEAFKYIALATALGAAGGGLAGAFDDPAQIRVADLFSKEFRKTTGHYKRSLNRIKSLEQSRKASEFPDMWKLRDATEFPEEAADILQYYAREMEEIEQLNAMQMAMADEGTEIGMVFSDYDKLSPGFTTRVAKEAENAKMIDEITNLESMQKQMDKPKTLYEDPAPKVDAEAELWDEGVHGELDIVEGVGEIPSGTDVSGAVRKAKDVLARIDDNIESLQKALSGDC